jgi:ATP-dependent exoDNAse (exonuclease V) beta subunit
VLIDYKTDAVPVAKLTERVAHYRPQVVLYADVWRRLTGEPVKEVGLYFTHLRRHVRVDVA